MRTQTYTHMVPCAFICEYLKIVRNEKKKFFDHIYFFGVANRCFTSAMMCVCVWSNIWNTYYLIFFFFLIFVYEYMAFWIFYIMKNYSNFNSRTVWAEDATRCCCWLRCACPFNFICHIKNRIICSIAFSSISFVLCEVRCSDGHPPHRRHPPRCIQFIYWIICGTSRQRQFFFVFYFIENLRIFV